MGDNVSADISRDGEKVVEADILLIDNNPDQPRQNFDKAKLEELAQSIRAHGIMQPIIVSEKGGRYTIIAGERRFRAAKSAGLKKVPVIVREFEERDKLELALIENVQREDLNPIEQAKALKTLSDKYKLTQQTLSERVGKNRSTIANLMRLLELPEAVKDMVEKGELSGGHARALLALNGGPDIIEETALKAVKEGWSVRDAEKNVKAALEKAASNESESKQNKNQDSSHGGEFSYAEERMSEALETRVLIKGSEKKGKIVIEYYSREQLEQLYEAINALL